MKNRRLFIKSLFSLPLLFTINPKIKAEIQTKKVLLNRCSVAGFQFYDGKEVINNLKENVQLQLSAEPDNQYDKYAVDVYFKNKKLGYIPKNENKHVSRILQAGVQLDCRTHKINSQNYAWNAVVIDVYM